MALTKSLIKQPSAWLPIAMSFTALTLTIGYLAIFGIAQPPPEDEGTAAHLFQLLMGGQVPIIAFLAIKWFPQKPKQSLLILALQFVATLLAFTPVYFLEL